MTILATILQFSMCRWPTRFTPTTIISDRIMGGTGRRRQQIFAMVELVMCDSDLLTSTWRDGETISRDSPILLFPDFLRIFREFFPHSVIHAIHVSRHHRSGRREKYCVVLILESFRFEEFPTEDANSLRDRQGRRLLSTYSGFSAVQCPSSSFP